MSDFSEITYSSSQVVCENPRLIINPLLPELIAKHHTYYLRGRRFHDGRLHQHYFSFNYRSFSIKRNGITKADIPTSFVLDETTGEMFPIYIEVPCNHCDVCKERKISAFVQRCKLETQVYDSKPWFLTLTYDNEHCPIDGVSIDEAQRYLKRLRINLVRAGFDKKIRYVLVGEYGKNTHRPHYHAIIWNIQAYNHQDYLRIVDILYKSWNKGYIQHRIINPENDKAFYYTAKYLKKDCIVPKGCNPTFVLSSRGHGGIGSKFLDGIAPVMRKTLNVSFKYLNKWSNKLEDLVFSQYVLNRLFPSWSKSVPSILRRSLADWCLNFSYIIQRDPNNLFINQLKHQYHAYKSFFGEYCYFAFVPFADVTKDVRELCTDAFGTLRNTSLVIDKYYKKIDFEEVQKIADKRGLFCSKLFLYATSCDISARSFRARRNFSLSSAREIL